MGNYVAIPIIALFCYVFLMIAIISARKNRLINSFLIVLGALVLWTGGSFCMRMLFFPSIKFWYDVSILGLTLMPYAFFIFISEFVGSQEVLFRRIWLLLIAAVNIVNISTGALLAHPELVSTAGGYRFIYNPTWTVVIMFGVCGIIVIHLLYILIKNSRNNELLRKQFTPIVIGILLLFAGNILIMVPIFNGIPLDILAGVFNAFLMLYALYKRRLFKLTLLVSGGICYFITIGIAVLIFYNTIPEMQRYITSRITSETEFQVLIIAISFSLLILLLYKAIKKFIDTVFIKDELTGLINRKYFYETLQEEYIKHKNNSLALIILNIDDFKLYNQLYGYKEGDIALKNIAHIIKTAVGQKGIVSRYSGKEFAIILPFYDILSAKNLAENIRKQILNMNKKSKDYPLKALTVSGGICAIPHSANTVKQLVDNADMAVYHAKRRGKNLILAYSVEKKDLENEINDIVEEKKADIYSEYASTIFALTAAIDAKDHYTFNHSKRVAYYATRLAYAYGMDEDFVRIIKEAALLHDIGKIGVPEQILNKPGKLTDEEYDKIKGHVENSIGIIRHLPSLDYVIPAVIGHHERYDGKGYPRGIAGEDIPLSARMLCIADAFDAITTQRTYKQPSTVMEALEILEANAGRQFDPVLVPIFVQLVENGLINIDDESIKMYE